MCVGQADRRSAGLKAALGMWACEMYWSRAHVVLPAAARRVACLLAAPTWPSSPPPHQGLKALRGRRDVSRRDNSLCDWPDFFSGRLFGQVSFFEKPYDNFYSPSFTTSPFVRLAPRAPRERGGSRQNLTPRFNPRRQAYPATCRMPGAARVGFTAR